jgi:hypothetical protein
MKLSNFLRPKHTYKLLRLGRNNDGGYLICEKSLYDSSCLISLGINDDWTFEKHFFEIRKNLKVECYDDQISLFFLIKNFIKSFLVIFYLFNLKNFLRSLYNIFEYPIIKKKLNIIKKKISYNDLNKILYNKKNLFIKIDIEGFEYRILEDILKNQKNIKGMVIEFHDCDLHESKIINFIKQLDLKLIHIHANNFSDLDKFNNPLTIELSFSKNPTIIKKSLKLPNKLDMPNNPESKEIKLNFR